MQSTLFSHHNVPLDLLAKRAYNFRWAEVDAGIIPLTAADPDFQVALEVRNAIASYAMDGVLSYGPHGGLSQFKHALANVLSERKSYDISCNNLLPVDSAASAMYSVARTFLSAGDEAIIFDPVDFLFEKSVTSAGAKVIRCPFDKSSGRFMLELLPKLISRKTKMIGVCNPHNPLGKLLSPQEIEDIARFANEHQLWIMNDEVWSDIIYPENQFFSFHHLASNLRQKVVTVYGFSKNFGLAGLRIGAIIAPDDNIYQRIVNTSNVLTTAGGASVLSQIAAITALTQCWYWVDEFIKHLTEMRDYAVTRLNNMPGIQCEKPQATYLLFPNIEATGFTAEDFSAKLLNEKVAVVPGTKRFFGPGAKGHIRISFATSKEILSEGLNRIERAVSKEKEN
ncbi:pyridoxal phosphate-dependent aminotransferase [Aliikangiella coralliicola]|uniref:Aminotransferase n=2 Tax=Aliikangiella coralliicola TaxID=2592383 RepID=A0A545U805_9GAMM|nr:pyridoxal phosphate-dependent aminotransferase [Aliikangiella coralliicola]